MTELIVALDVDSLDESKKVVSESGEEGVWFKVGSQLFTKEGPRVVEYLKSLDKKVMLDLKYFDIPNTVKKAVKEAVGIGADMLTLHALGGRKMMEFAAEAVGGTRVKLLAVTVLTSFDEESWTQTTMTSDLSVKDSVFRLAHFAYHSGISGIVCSPEETKLVLRGPSRDKDLPVFVVNPGIRPEWSLGVKDDQARFTTPKKAKEEGASFIVVGRPIIQHENPAEAIRLIKEELGNE